METEKVLDVPAFDFTDEGLAKGAKVARDGSVGQQVFERVSALEGEGMKRQEAFEKVAEENGAKAGTVAANFYRVARASGTAKVSKRGRKPKEAADETAKPVRAARANGDMADVAGDLAQIIQRMVDIAVDARLRKIIQ